MNVVAHNLLAMNTNTQLQRNVRKKDKSTEKLSSGYRINRSADDAAGLSISEKMRNQIRNLNQATNNVEDGISVCQVADGALSEITSIIHRLEELSVHAANDVLAEEDRKACDDEMQELLGEIDKVGHDTQFNGIYLFRGRDVQVGAPGTKMSDVTPDQLELGFQNLQLGTSAPFAEGSNGNTLNLGVSAKADSAVAGAAWSLIFGNGGTSHPSVRVAWENPDTGAIQKNVIKLENCSEVSGSYVYDSANQTYSRKLSLMDQTLDKTLANGDKVQFSMEATETIRLVDNGIEKHYEISYKITTNTNDSDLNLKYDFMYNCDSAYNNNDQCEGYYIGGQRVTGSTIYTSNADYLAQGNGNVSATIPNDFSICNVDAALGFTETVGIAGTPPNTISLGRWTQVDQWGYYDQLDSNLGQDIVGRDLAFSFIWNEDLNGNLANGTSEKEYTIKQGIASIAADQNIKGITIKYDTTRLVRHESELPMYIQSGANSGEDLRLEFREVNQTTIGVLGMSCLTRQDAEQAMDQVKQALYFTNDFRSAIGAKQNRLEYTAKGNMNYSENLTYAESLIRDTDMSTEMTEFSKQNILLQAAQSMLSQANLSQQSILQLLQ